MKALAVVALSTLVLAGCASTETDAPWTHWTCDNQTQVFWRLADASGDAVDLRLGSDSQVRRLLNEPAADGALYSDGQLSFHAKGQRGLVYWTASDDLIGLDCKAR